MGNRLVIWAAGSAVVEDDVGPGFANERRQRLVQAANNDAPAAGVEKTDGRLDLWPHAARREMALRVVSAHLGHRDPTQFWLLGRF